MAKTTITQDEINRAAWAICDTFRGVLDPSQYKDYILVMLFFKYVSDQWQEHEAAYRAKYKGDEERIRRQLARERFVLPDVILMEQNSKTKKSKETERFIASFQSLYERRERPNIGELIDMALAAIGDANKEQELELVFRGISFNSEIHLGATKERNERLKNLLNDLNGLDLRPSRISEDIIGNTYIYLIERFASDAGKKAGEFYTPAQVSRLLARLADPQPGARICDPSCGSGGLLIEAAHVVAEHPGQEDQRGNFMLYGQEVNQATWALARMNMFIHKLDSAKIRRGDTLRSPQLVENDRLMTFDVVVANPPFSLDKWGAETAAVDPFKRFWRGLPPKSKGDYAFVSHMIEAAKPLSGRVAVVVPHGVLFRGGAEGRIRQRLIEDNLLDAVIGLPANLFPTTSIPVAILLFDRARERGGARARQKDVMFVDASSDFASAKAHNLLTDAAMTKIIKTVKARKAVEKYASLASLDMLAENDFNLNIPRYVDTFEEEEEIDLKATELEIQRLEKELEQVRLRMKKHLKELGL
jgi:type I restriction enzyme M protein